MRSRRPQSLRAIRWSRRWQSVKRRGRGSSTLRAWGTFEITLKASARSSRQRRASPPTRSLVTSGHSWRGR
eukprot:11209666-Lingulodinium_polyedra.AAC.1